MPAQFRNAPASVELPRPRTDWWREFSSAELDRLQDHALSNNRELGVAIARVAQAQAQARVADAARYPSIEAFGRSEAIGPEEGPGSAETREQWRTRHTYQLGLRTNYEIDLWGKQGYAVDSALALAAASVHQREAVALALTADVTGAYFEYLSLNDRIAIGERGLLNRRSASDAVAKRLQHGDATVLEAAQQVAAVATTASAQAALVQRRERAFNRLAFLTGMPPAELKLAARSLAGVPVPNVNPGLPPELLCRRPDVRRIEAQLAAAQLDVRSLRAGLLPSFTIQAELGHGSRHLAALANPASLFFLLAGTIVQTLIDAGKREAQLEVARAKYLEMLQQYAGVLLAALREVEDALVAGQVTKEQQAALEEAAAKSRSAYDFTRKSYNAGAVDLFGLLDAEQRVVASEAAAEELRHERLRAAIDLYRSLGGGTRTDDGDPCAT